MRRAAKAVIQDNPELADELEAAIMEAMKAADKRRVPTAAAKATAAPSEAAEESEKVELDIDEFDDDLADEFSIEEDL